MELGPQNTANSHDEARVRGKPAGQEWAFAKALLGKGSTQG